MANAAEHGGKRKTGRRKGARPLATERPVGRFWDGLAHSKVLAGRSRKP